MDISLMNSNISNFSISDIEKLFEQLRTLNDEVLELGLENSALRALLKFKKELDNLFQ